MPQIDIEIFGRARYDASADLLALIAYPDSEESRASFTKAMLNKIVQSTGYDDPTWKADIPVTRYMPYGDVDRVFRDGLKELEDRITIGEAVKPFVAEAIYARRGIKTILGDGTPLSLDAILTRLASSPGNKGERSLAQAWKESRPIIHLCFALANAYIDAADLRKSRAGVQLDQILNFKTLSILKCAACCRWVLLNSDKNRPRRGPNARPQFADSEMVRVSWR